jgi:hypothetical protein
MVKIADCDTVLQMVFGINVLFYIFELVPHTEERLEVLRQRNEELYKEKVRLTQNSYAYPIGFVVNSTYPLYKSQRVKGSKGSKGRVKGVIKGVKPYICIVLFIRSSKGSNRIFALFCSFVHGLKTATLRRFIHIRFLDASEGLINFFTSAGSRSLHRFVSQSAHTLLNQRKTQRDFA